LRIRDRIDSDHHPVEIQIKGERKKGNRKGKKRKEWRGVWDREGRNEFIQRIGEIERMRIEKLDELWGEMEGRVKKALREVEEERKKEKKLKL